MTSKQGLGCNTRQQLGPLIKQCDADLLKLKRTGIMHTDDITICEMLYKVMNSARIRCEIEEPIISKPTKLNEEYFVITRNSHLKDYYQK